MEGLCYSIQGRSFQDQQDAQTRRQNTAAGIVGLRDRSLSTLSEELLTICTLYHKNPFQSVRGTCMAETLFHPSSTSHGWLSPVFGQL